MNILVTGSSKGIGYSLALYYATRGHTVYGCSRGDSNITHEKYKHFIVDITDESSVVEMVRRINKIDVLINNAGIASMNQSLLTSIKTAKELFDVNFFGSFLFCREVGKKMLKVKQGCIINFSSLAVHINLEGEMVYAASKSAVETMTRILAKEVGSSGIRVNAIAPSPIKTDLIKNVPEEKINKIVSSRPLKRLCEFSDIIDTANFIIYSPSLTGQIIYL